MVNISVFSLEDCIMTGANHNMLSSYLKQVTFKCLTKGLFLPDDKAEKVTCSFVQTFTCWFYCWLPSLFSVALILYSICFSVLFVLIFLKLTLFFLSLFLFPNWRKVLLFVYINLNHFSFIFNFNLHSSLLIGANKLNLLNSFQNWFL